MWHTDVQLSTAGRGRREQQGSQAHHHEISEHLAGVRIDAFTQLHLMNLRGINVQVCVQHMLVSTHLHTCVTQHISTKVGATHV